MAASMALTQLMKPLNWTHLHVPHAPVSMIVDLIHYPAPFILGLSTDEKQSAMVSSSLITYFYSMNTSYSVFANSFVLFRFKDPSSSSLRRDFSWFRCRKSYASLWVCEWRCRDGRWHQSIISISVTITNIDISRVPGRDFWLGNLSRELVFRQSSWYHFETVK
jgi:hypothetical protein